MPSLHEDIELKILVSLPPDYPTGSPPQLQLLSRWIGSFAPDSDLFAAVLKTYISVNGVQWDEDTGICVFDGLSKALEYCTAWYEGRLASDQPTAVPQLAQHDASPDTLEPIPVPQQSIELPEGIQIFEAEPIIDRRSSFVGRACGISDPAQVPLILSYLSADRRIARAAHPIINAWRCQVGNVLHQDNDDDGETAAGGRLAHLLQIMELQNVLVVVTRYFGGIHLGPDRFKHINQAARNALELGGFLDTDVKKARKRH